MAGGGGNEPNLTPFIDLFSVLICFLLMTAAWIQLESMPTTIEKAPPLNAEAPAEPPPPDKDEKKTKLEVVLTKEKAILKEDEAIQEIPNAGESFNSEQIKSVLANWRQKYPEKKDIVLSTEATVTYGNLISMYDLMILSDWPDVGINPH